MTGERRRDMTDFAVKVGVLENNTDLLTKIVTKMEAQLEKTQEVATNLVRIAAVQEERLNNQDKNLEGHKGDDSDKFDKLTTLVENSKSELAEKIESVQRQIEPIKKFVYMAMGGASIIMVLLEAISLFLK